MSQEEFGQMYWNGVRDALRMTQTFLFWKEKNPSEDRTIETFVTEALEAVRVFSYMEEFRLQAQKDEKICVEGNLEEVVSPKGRFHQITLTYCPRYYEQVLKVTASNT